jgi:peptidylglycine monooxygenase
MASLFATVLGALVGIALSAPVKESANFDISMPAVQPDKADTYLCYPLELKDGALYLTGFEPHANMSMAHHMLLYGCAEPGDSQKEWNCGEMAAPSEETGPVCKSGAQIIYAWAMNAPDLRLPKDVAFKVGGMTGIKWLVLQVHYKVALTKKDSSGITIEATTTPQPKRAGVYLLGTGGEIAPKSNVFMETACSYDEPIDIHPFAYRVHAHTHGEVISGYKVTEETDGAQKWTEIGRQSPQVEEMFYNVTTPGMTIHKGDVLAARCTMVNDEDRVVKIGNTGHDEMCNFYLMYWVDGDKIMSQNYCFTQGPPSWSWNDIFDMSAVPSSASLVPGAKEAITKTEKVLENAEDNTKTEKVLGNAEDNTNTEKVLGNAEDNFLKLMEELLEEEKVQEQPVPYGNGYQGEEENVQEQPVPYGNGYQGEEAEDLRMPYGYNKMEEEYEPNVVPMDDEYEGSYNPTYQRVARAEQQYQDTYDLLKDIEQYYDNME